MSYTDRIITMSDTICQEIRNQSLFKTNRNHRKYVARKGSIPVSNHFDIEGHNLKALEKFLFIEQLSQTKSGQIESLKTIEK